jgi:hypothetical protein
MATKVLGPTGSRRRYTRTSLMVMALLGLVFGVMIGGGGIGSAASGTDASVSDYAQCANGKPGTANPDDCNKGMIFGILNPNNSQYAEDQATAQRLILSLPAGGLTSGRTITLKYLVRKGTHHAYDSLASWDWTIDGSVANACASLSGPAGNTCTSIFNAGAKTKGIPDDTTTVTPGTGANGTTVSTHMVPAGTDREMRMFGLGTGEITEVAYVGGLLDESGDLYRTIKVTYSVESLVSARTVMLLFGGHLAAGGDPSTGSVRGWGGTNGAADISGGPYHIKLIQVDGSAIGNRDNQIMSSAIVPFFSPSHSTTPNATATYDATFSDKLTLSGTDGSPTGNVTFRLYDSSANCLAHGTTVGTGGLVYSNDVAVTATDTLSGSKTVTGLTGNVDYYWWVSYPGDDSNAPVLSDCVEHSAITAPAITSYNDPAS